MKRPDLLLLSLVLGLSGCAGTTDASRSSEPELCLQKLVGTWEGDVKAIGRLWPGGTGRTLILYRYGDNGLRGSFGARSLGLLKIQPEIIGNCEIRFIAAPGVNADWIRLFLIHDDVLQGDFNWTNMPPVAIQLRKQP